MATENWLGRAAPEWGHPTSPTAGPSHLPNPSGAKGRRAWVRGPGAQPLEPGQEAGQEVHGGCENGQWCLLQEVPMGGSLSEAQRALELGIPVTCSRSPDGHGSGKEQGH